MALTNAHKKMLEHKIYLSNLTGLTVDEITKARQSYISQVHACNKKLDRNKNKVDMKLSFDEWLIFWVNSGHWYQRGKKLGEYCMCRKDDIGHYELGNVYIDLASTNSSTAIAPIRSEEYREMMRQKYIGKPRPASVIKKGLETKLKNKLLKGKTCVD